MYRETYWLLRKTSKYLKKILSTKIEEYGITWQQFHAMYHIDDNGIPFNELAKHLNCNASNMTGLIDRMTENGWVYREQSKEDRRVWLIKLTEEGQKLKEELLPKHQKNINIIMQRLSDDELQMLKQLLLKFYEGENY